MCMWFSQKMSQKMSPSHLNKTPYPKLLNISDPSKKKEIFLFKAKKSLHKIPFLYPHSTKNKFENSILLYKYHKNLFKSLDILSISKKRCWRITKGNRTQIFIKLMKLIKRETLENTKRNSTQSDWSHSHTHISKRFNIDEVV